MSIPFTKMNGCGNDFIIIDNRAGILNEKDIHNFGRRVCNRNFSLGADGLLLIEQSKKYDFKARLINPDGSEGEMCGNGMRCMAKYAFTEGIAEAEMSFETLAGRINARVNGNEVDLELPDVRVKDIVRHKSIAVKGKNLKYSSVFLGVPHCAIFLEENLPDEELFELGRAIRFNKEHFPMGTNVNFILVESKDCLYVRTYERGVEDITLSCGTGSASSAIIGALDKRVTAPTTVRTMGGVLKVTYELDRDAFKNIVLTGPVTLVASGELFAY